MSDLGTRYANLALGAVYGGAGIRTRKLGTAPLEALIDEDLAGYLSQWKWHVEYSNPSRSGKPYVVRRSKVGGKQTRVYMHRLVMRLPHDDPRRVDHVNGDTFDNRRENLRVVTVAQNAQNQGSRGGSSSYRGVTWDKARQKWMAGATLNGKRTTIGRFGSELEAHAAATRWRADNMPFSADAMGRAA